MRQPSKVMLTLDHDTYKKLEKIAAKKGLTVQELIRRVVLPEWVDREEGSQKKR